MSRIASHHNLGSTDGAHRHAPGPHGPGAPYGHRPLWALVAATNQVLSAARWRRAAASDPRQAAPGAPVPLHPAAAPTSGWFHRPTATPGALAQSSPHNGLRVVGAR